VTRIVFAGTPDFALASLRALVESGRTPVAVLTQPDRPAGRGKKLTASPVKQYAVQHGIPVQQPVTLRDEQAAAELAALEPDVLVVAAYGLILPQAVLDIPRHGCLNVHASILPRWRGAAPIQAAILAGDAKTGISLMAMTAGLDCGPVFHIEELDIGPDETAGELHDRLAVLGGEALVARLDAILAGDVRAVPQDDTRATYAPKIDKQDARIDWSLPAREAARQIRAYNPFPGAYCFHGDTRIKVWRATAVDRQAPAGTVLQCDREAVVVASGEGALRLEELQLPGKRRVSAPEFAGQLDLNGQRLD
jgi:methionyl-tRNA formyltransferase